MLGDDQLLALVEPLTDRYVFRSLVGEGGTGRVFEVVNRGLGRVEALKILKNPGDSEDEAARFAVEARIAASLDHPQIVKVYEFGQVGLALWYSMQRIDGPTLAAIVEAGRTLDAQELARVAIPILEALAYSHKRGVVHRDIKSANILFSLAGRPFLTDFGIAKAVESPLITRTGQMLGTPAYVAPEQAMGEQVDARADLYSLGVSLYMAASGRFPFQAEGVLQTLLIRLRENPPPLESLCPSLPLPVVQVIMRALARKPADRWPSAEAMRAAFLQACQQTGLSWDGPLELAKDFVPEYRDLPTQPMSLVHTDPTLPMTPVQAPARRRTWLWTMLVGLVAVGALELYRHRSSPAQVPPPSPQTQGVSAPQPGPGATSSQGANEPQAQSTSAAASAPQLREPGGPSARGAATAPVAPARPAPKTVPAPEPPIIRRAVVYPQLLGDATAPAPPAGCAGRTVDVSLVVGEDGLVKTCRILSNLDPACAEAARAVALRYHFRPALDAQGQPVQATVAATVQFLETP